ncbi:hypothetical protein HOY82DRAFT_649487 [Tuber indicum]|nr:hypothetical protein HOY82DRAFT_649487 [Tuber indicum]
MYRTAPYYPMIPILALHYSSTVLECSVAYNCNPSGGTLENLFKLRLQSSVYENDAGETTGQAHSPIIKTSTPLSSRISSTWSTFDPLFHELGVRSRTPKCAGWQSETLLPITLPHRPRDKIGTPLRRGHGRPIVLAKLLPDGGAQTGSRGRHGGILLFAVVRYRDTGVAKRLVEHGADISTSNGWEISITTFLAGQPIAIDSLCGDLGTPQTDVVGPLMDSGACVRAAGGGSLAQIVPVLYSLRSPGCECLEKGAEPDVPNAAGLTALHHAVSGSGALENFQELPEIGRASTCTVVMTRRRSSSPLVITGNYRRELVEGPTNRGTHATAQCNDGRGVAY